MTLSLAQNAIALLIDLAERGEIDPWDVQVIEVIDRFLSKLQPVQVTHHEAGRSPYEADLSQSGQAFLYASMLLLLKADSLARLEVEEVGEPEDIGEFLEVEGLDAPLPRNLERRIRRRAVVPPVQNRRVTLQELIAQLNLMATAMADQQPRRVGARRARPQSRTQAIRAIAQLAHQENLSEVATALEGFLLEHWQDISQEQDWLDFEVLLGIWSNSQVQGNSEPKKPAVPSAPLSSPEEVTQSIHDRVGVFWALLFLSAQSKVELAQEEFYQDLKVRSLADNPLPGQLESSAFALSD
jgi:segregation and condensation protein A